MSQEEIDRLRAEVSRLRAELDESREIVIPPLAERDRWQAIAARFSEDVREVLRFGGARHLERRLRETLRVYEGEGVER